MKFTDVAISIKNLISNIRSLFKYNIEKDAIQNLESETLSLKCRLKSTTKSLIELYLFNNQSEQKIFHDELSYLRTYGIVDAFPYRQEKKLPFVTCGFDKKERLPFVLHKEQKLYFPATWTVNQAKKAYINYIERENLLGGNFTSKSPHQYVTESFNIEFNDIVVDCGCAEGLFALNSIDKAKHVYLFECDEIWMKPLQATFNKYKNKVTIIKKCIGDKNNEYTTTLQNFFEKFYGEKFFIKMDIEGNEEIAITSSLKFLSSKNNFKLACCTYHRANHAQAISKELQDLGYTTNFSDGYMLFLDDHNQQPPFFRKGLIRASLNNA